MQKNAKSIEHDFWHTSTGVWKIIAAILMIIIVLLLLVAKFSHVDNLIEYGNFRAKAPHYTWILAKPAHEGPNIQTHLSTKEQIKFPSNTNNPIIYIRHTKYHVVAHHYEQAIRNTHLIRLHLMGMHSSFDKLRHNDRIFELRHDDKYFLLIQEHKVK